MLGDELGGLISQLPQGLIVLTCGSGLLWLALMAYFAVIRPARKRQREAAALAAAPPPPAYFSAPTDVLPLSPQMNSAADLPDLDMLMGTAAPELSAAPSASTTPKSAARRLGSADVTLSDGITIHASEILLILRDPRDNSLIVQVDETGYKSLADSPVRDAVRRILSEFGQQSGMSSARAAQSAAPSAPQVSSPPPVTRSGLMPGDLPKFNEIRDEIKSRGALRPHKTETPPVPELNIPGAIEAYLQYKKSFTPEYAKRSIHVLPGLSGGVRIEVDGVYYDAVSDVSDPEVRAFLQATIQEWQSRQ